MIGIAILTYKRPRYFVQCLTHLYEKKYGGADKVFVINDSGEDYLEHYEKIYKNMPEEVTVINNEKNLGCAKSKNKALKAMMDAGCDHLFIIEDDILVKRADACHQYIKYANKVGLKHLNFALHGNMNTGRKLLIEWQNKEVWCFPECVGAFSYYAKEAIEKVGYMDENFVNAYEHVDHTYRMGIAGMTTPFWYFADHPVSHKILEEIAGSIDNSSIRPRPDWELNIKKAKDYWIKKYGQGMPPYPH